MRSILFAALFVLSSCAHRSVAPALSEEQLLAQCGYSIVSTCTILDLQGVPVRQFGGGRCIFFDDGTYLVGDSKSLAFMSKDHQVLWRRQLHTHHILTQTSDGNILVGTSEERKYRGQNVRFDVLLKIDRQGNELARFSFFDHREEILNSCPELRAHRLMAFGWDAGSDLKAKTEFTHMNSYYEISPLDGISVEGFRAGDILINSAEPRDFLIVVDPQLKAIRFFHLLQSDAYAMGIAHDVQMLKNGWLLVYDNVDGISAEKEIYSSIDEIDPLTWKLAWRFIDVPATRFQSETEGGVQSLPNGEIFFSDITKQVARVRIVDREFHQTFNLPLQLGEFRGMQDAKLKNVSKFLSNNLAL